MSPKEEIKKQIKDFKIALKDMEPMVRDPRFLTTGREISNFSLRPREAWANWLLCVVLRKLYGEDITFVEDEECDGVILEKSTGQCIRTEHVMALDLNPSSGKILPQGEMRVIEAINHKIDKGADYAKGKYLIVFFDGAGEYFRDKIREAINGRHNFIRIYCIGLLAVDDYGYTYAVTELHETYSITFKVQINSDFTDWEITQI